MIEVRRLRFAYQSKARMGDDDMKTQVAPVPTAVHPPSLKAPRMVFVDHLRVFLTVLVIAHHTMITYAGSGSWAYVEGREDLFTAIVGKWFCSINQAYFMGLFLLISAYFVPGSYDRKGPGRFLLDRLVRLGIPLAIYSWLVRPALVYLGETMMGAVKPPFVQWLFRGYFTEAPILGGGPLWFIEALLLFSIVYVFVRWASRSKKPSPVSPPPFPSSGRILVFALLLAAATFAVRGVLPVGWNFLPLNFQLPYFAQYIALFIVGLLAFRGDWLRQMPDALGRRWLVIALALTVVFPVIVLLFGPAADNSAFLGGWHWQSAFWSTIETLLCIGWSLGLVYLFRRFANRSSKVGAFLVPNAYGAYLVHEPVIIFMALGMSGLSLYPLLKFGIVVLVGATLCFAIAAGMRKIPGAKRVL
jgi:Acyltransferase family